MDKGREFLEDYLNFRDVTDFEVAAVVLLLYHSFGPSELKKPSADSIIYQQLGDDGMLLFKLIFDNNNKELINMFFSNDLIIKLWAPVIFKFLTFESCFGNNGPNDQIEYTFRVMSHMMSTQFGLRMPKWWLDRFPYAPAATYN